MSTRPTAPGNSLITARAGVAELDALAPHRNGVVEAAEIEQFAAQGGDTRRQGGRPRDLIAGIAQVGRVAVQRVLEQTQHDVERRHGRAQLVRRWPRTAAAPLRARRTPAPWTIRQPRVLGAAEYRIGGSCEKPPSRGRLCRRSRDVSSVSAPGGSGTPRTPADVAARPVRGPTTHAPAEVSIDPCPTPHAGGAHSP
jgi:hypothetical protein